MLGRFALVRAIERITSRTELSEGHSEGALHSNDVIASRTSACTCIGDENTRATPPTGAGCSGRSARCSVWHIRCSRVRERTTPRQRDQRSMLLGALGITGTFQASRRVRKADASAGAPCDPFAEPTTRGPKFPGLRTDSAVARRRVLHSRLKVIINRSAGRGRDGSGVHAPFSLPSSISLDRVAWRQAPTIGTRVVACAASKPSRCCLRRRARRRLYVRDRACVCSVAARYERSSRGDRSAAAHGARGGRIPGIRTRAGA